MFGITDISLGDLDISRVSLDKFPNCQLLSKFSITDLLRNIEEGFTGHHLQSTVLNTVYSYKPVWPFHLWPSIKVLTDDISQNRHEMEKTLFDLISVCMSNSVLHGFRLRVFFQFEMATQWTLRLWFCLRIILHYPLTHLNCALCSIINWNFKCLNGFSDLVLLKRKNSGFLNKTPL